MAHYDMFMGVVAIDVGTSLCFNPSGAEIRYFWGHSQVINSNDINWDQQTIVFHEEDLLMLLKLNAPPLLCNNID